jgi:hypothetical protein
MNGLAGPRRISPERRRRSNLSRGGEAKVALCNGSAPIHLRNTAWQRTRIQRRNDAVKPISDNARRRSWRNVDSENSSVTRIRQKFTVSLIRPDDEHHCRPGGCVPRISAILRRCGRVKSSAVNSIRVGRPHASGITYVAQ